MILRHFRLSPELVNSYVLVDEGSRQALLVDAGEFSNAIIDFMASGGYSLRAIFITHSHYDHNQDVQPYVDRFQPEAVYGGSPESAGKHTTVVHDGDEIAVGQMRGRVLAIPGHTVDLMALYFPEQKVL